MLACPEGFQLEDPKFEDIQDAFLSTYNPALALDYCDHTFIEEREVREDMADEISEHRRLTNLGMPDGHGGLIFIGPRFQFKIIESCDLAEIM